ncbi:hypothetical protein BHE74_00009449, partial [Ensete ventricosum]
WLGIDAKEATVHEVAKILPLPDLLISIVSIKADYLSRQPARIASSSCSPRICSEVSNFGFFM